VAYCGFTPTLHEFFGLTGIFTFGGIAAPHAPALQQGTDAVSLAEDQKIVNDFAATLQGMPDALGECAQ
jgi:hypothetical protein